MSSEIVLINGKKGKLVNMIKFWDNIISKKGFENLILSRYIDVKRGRKNYIITYQTNFCIVMKEYGMAKIIKE